MDIYIDIGDLALPCHIRLSILKRSKLPYMRIPLSILCLSCAVVANLCGQIVVTSTSVVSPGVSHAAYARFSADGAKLYFTTSSYDGIQEYAFATRSVRTITSDIGAGYNFALSPDGRSISYRRTIAGATVRNRMQEAITQDLATGSRRTLGSARAVSSPVYDGAEVVFIKGSELVRDQPTKKQVTVVGVNAEKIILLVNGTLRTVAPFGTGAIIWPSLSPDGSRILATDMDRGTFVCDLNGNVVATLGRIDGPTWTRDGRWVIGFSEKNDGHHITGSDLVALRSDGTGRVALTSTPNQIELFPSCSPVDNRIVCHTMDGNLVVLTYQVTE